MSVQNPERVVTKQDLADFYEQILPYLGGMPEILANKFSKGDMYNTDEKMIGQWIDGKPLYSKTIQSVIPAAGSDTTVLLSSLGIDSLVNLESSISVFSTMPPIGGYMAEPSNISITRVQVFVSDSGTLYIRNINYAAQAGKTIYVTLKYTKTTDSPISIGNDTDYSTDEKIIGTWIDGRPIWQKTLNENITVQTDDWVNTSMSSTNVDRVINCSVVAESGSWIPCLCSIGTTYLRLRWAGGVSGGAVASQITIQYVKATS